MAIVVGIYRQGTVVFGTFSNKLIIATFNKLLVINNKQQNSHVYSLKREKRLLIGMI